MPETVIENKVNSDFKEHQIKSLKILIAEDDEASGILISNIVKAYCKTELKVKTGVEAVEACQANPDIDLILMDIKMQEMDGYEATRQIRQFNKDVIIIAQTAFALTGDKERALQAGCNDYISKPIDSNLLIEIIQKYFKK
jgi:CheY-like chemotaxis protein